MGATALTIGFEGALGVARVPAGWTSSQTLLVGYPLGAYQVQGWLATRVPRFPLHSQLVPGFLLGVHWAPIGSITACWLPIRCHSTDWTPTGCNNTCGVSIRSHGFFWVSTGCRGAHQVPFGCPSGASVPSWVLIRSQQSLWALIGCQGAHQV